MRGRWVGPHTADTQQRADRLVELCADRDVLPVHVAAQMVADDVLRGADPWPAALVYDACGRAERWATVELLTSCGYVQSDGSGYDKLPEVVSEGRLLLTDR
jgi:hypothetical protein